MEEITTIRIQKVKNGYILYPEMFRTQGQVDDHSKTLVFENKGSLKTFIDEKF